MNTLFQILIVITASLAAELAHESPTPRKLIFSPYLNINEDLSAKENGQENETPGEHEYNPFMGPFQNAPVPAFGLGGLMPPSLGLTNMPYNYMYGSPMLHPLNPSNPGNPLDSLDGKENQGFEQPMAGFGGASGVDRQLGGWSALINSPVTVGLHCKDRRKQTIEIAKAIMKKQNKILFQELMDYLLKTKTVISSSELQLTKAMRSKMYSLMNHFGNLQAHDLTFVEVEDENDGVIKPLVHEETEDESDGLASISLDIGGDNDEQRVEITSDQDSMTESGPEIEDMFNNP